MTTLLAASESSPVYRRWTESRGFVPAEHAKGFSVPGGEFEGVRLFTAAEIDHEARAWVWRAYEGRTGLAIGEPHRHRSLCERAAIRELRGRGRKDLESAIAEALAGRGE